MEVGRKRIPKLLVTFVICAPGVTSPVVGLVVLCLYRVSVIASGNVAWPVVTQLPAPMLPVWQAKSVIVTDTCFTIPPLVRITSFPAWLN